MEKKTMSNLKENQSRKPLGTGEHPRRATDNEFTSTVQEGEKNTDRDINKFSLITGKRKRKVNELTEDKNMIVKKVKLQDTKQQIDTLITDQQEKRDHLEGFYERTINREPYPLFKQAVSSLLQEQKQEQMRALDLGCGRGIETFYLLDKGFHVTAVDNNENALTYIKEKRQSTNLELVESTLDQFAFNGPYDIVHAGYSLPFSHPQTFTEMFTQMIDSIREGGLFVGQLFGDKDEWHEDPNKTFHTKDDVEKIFSDNGMELTYEEVQQDDPYGDGTNSKHWHVFHITAKKMTLTLPEREHA